MKIFQQLLIIFIYIHVNAGANFTELVIYGISTLPVIPDFFTKNILTSVVVDGFIEYKSYIPCIKYIISKCCSVVKSDFLSFLKYFSYIESQHDTINESFVNNFYLYILLYTSHIFFIIS